MEEEFGCGMLFDGRIVEAKDFIEMGGDDVWMMRVLGELKRQCTSSKIREECCE